MIDKMIDKKLNYPILSLNFKDSFEQLTDEEKEYTYYLYKACWDGAPIVLFQVSYESAPLFIIFQTFFSSFQPFEEMKKVIMMNSAGKISDVEYKKFIRYAAKFYANLGNYLSFGKIKFIPEVDSDHFEEILKCSPAYNDMSYIWSCIKSIVYDDSLQFKTINLEEKGGKNSYYLRDIKEEEILVIDKYLLNKGIDPLNTRLMKISSNKYACLIGSVEEKIEELDNGILAYYGEFSPFLKRVNAHLEEAKKVCANDIQKQMLQYYIESFETGSIEKHKDSQRCWVKDKGPVVEMNIGWIETYIDPLGVRASYEGWVALADKEKSKKFNLLVTNGESLLTSLPWSMDFEKPHFSAPDFTALDIVCYAADSCPIGINIPNYLDVQETDGFKNISISNAYPSYKPENLIFCNEKDVELLHNIGRIAFTLHVACHELLGHGSGKQLKISESGELNFNIENTINPLTNKKIDKYYQPKETYESRFTDIARSFEECRADLAALYFCFFKDIQQIFEFDEALFNDIIYIIWLLYIRKGIIGLNLYNDTIGKWGQAHTQGAWVFTQYLLANQRKEGQEILTIKLDEEKKDFQIILNKEMILFYGQELVAGMFTSFHIWKATGDSEEAKAFYGKYSSVNDFFLKIRALVVENEIPRRLELNHNLKYNGPTSITIEEYPESLEGIIKSFVDRYETELNNDIYAQWTKYDTNFFK